MKKLLLLSYLLLCNIMLWAIQRSPEEAFSIAHSFFKQSSGATTRSSATDIQLIAVSSDLLTSTATRATEETSFYIYNNAQSAYVIVSGDNRMKPVLAYSYDGAFTTENIPENILAWLRLYQETYDGLNRNKTSLSQPKILAANQFPKSVSPLLNDIKWNQSAPYNNACPVVNGSRCVVGCVATAMAMVMKYHEYPVKGKYSHTYTANDITSSFDFESTTFDWKNMLPEYIPGKYTDKQAAAVAELMFACGVSVEMQYSPSSSGAYSHKVGQALIDFFGYDENLKYIRREYFTSTEWMNMIKDEISRGLPILYNAASTEVGHEFIFDGYDADDMVHVNWGWGGANNGYFEVSLLEPSSPGIGGGSGTGGGYVYQQGMIVGFQPPSDTSSYTSHFMLSKLTANKETFAKGETFDLTAVDMYNMSTLFKSGKLGIVAEKNGQQSVVWSTALNNVKTNYGSKEIKASGITITDAISDGTYALYLATKEDREANWSRVRGEMGYETQFTLAVEGNNCKLIPFAGTLNLGKDIEGTVEALHSLYSGRNGKFSVTFTNNSATEEYYGSTGVMFCTADKDMEAVAFIGNIPLDLKAGATKTVTISGKLVANQTAVPTNLAQGDYYIFPAMQWGEYAYSIGNIMNKVSVTQAFGSPSLVVENVQLEKNELVPGETIKLKADLSLSGFGNVYEAKLMAAIFASGQSSTTNLFYSEVFIEKGTPCDFNMHIETMLSEGEYRINLYKPEADGSYNGSNPLASLPFSIGTPTGIERETDREKGIVIYGQPVGNTLRIQTPVAIKSVAIHTSTGLLAMQQNVDSAGKELTISVEGLNSGYYIVTLLATDGKTYRSKFIKK